MNPGGLCGVTRGDLFVKTATCHTHITDSYEAGVRAANSVRQQLGDTHPHVLFVFTSVGHAMESILKGVRSTFPDVHLCGCSGAGTITDQGCDEMTHSLALMGIHSDQITFSPFLCTDLTDDQEQSGQILAEQVNPILTNGDKRHLLILFTEGLSINADALFRGLTTKLVRHVDIVGGAAGNDFLGENTFQFFQDSVISNGACGVVLSGNFSYDIGVTHGSRPIGLFRTITRADKNVILEIDDIPALELLKEYIGAQRVEDFGHVLNLFELGEQFDGQGYDEDIINRAITGVDTERAGIRLAVELPEGTRIRITRRDMDLVLKRTRQMTQTLLGHVTNPETTAFFYFNCSGRGSYLFGEPEPDVDVVRDTLGQDKRLIGFFTFGEFAPVKNTNHYHNYTGVLVSIEEV